MMGSLTMTVEIKGTDGLSIGFSSAGSSTLKMINSLLVIVLAIVVAAATDEKTNRMSNVHPIYDNLNSFDVNVYSSDASPQQQQRDESYYYPDESDRPVSYGADWTGDANPYIRNNFKKLKQQQDEGSSYRYPQPEAKQLEPSPYYSSNNGYGSQLYRPVQQKQYGYGPSSKPQKVKGKDKDLLWEFFEHFFAKKKELEDTIWDLVLHKDQKGSSYGGGSNGYGEPPADYYHKDQMSKEDIFKKIKFLAWAATVLLIILGSGIVLAPLAIGKGRRRSLADLLPSNVALPSTAQIAQLASNVLQAIQNYQQLQQQP